MKTKTRLFWTFLLSAWAVMGTNLLRKIVSLQTASFATNQVSDSVVTNALTSYVMHSNAINWILPISLVAIFLGFWSKPLKEKFGKKGNNE